MIYWRIELNDGRTGYQVMDDHLNNAQVLDDNGQPFAGNVEYKVTDANPVAPVWANA